MFCHILIFEFITIIIYLAYLEFIFIYDLIKYFFSIILHKIKLHDKENYSLQ
jgi:hypothetical protein